MNQESDLPFPQWPADFSARVRLLTAAEGGRSSSARAGYRPQVYFHIQMEKPMSTSGSWQKLDKEELKPGEEAIIDIAILAKGFFDHKLFAGLTFELAEGGTKVGEGEILGIYNKTLDRDQSVPNHNH